MTVWDQGTHMDTLKPKNSKLITFTVRGGFFTFWAILAHSVPWQPRQPSNGPCLDFGSLYTLIRNNWTKKFGVEYWTLPSSNLLWRPYMSPLK
jgi:hypothetical protein